MDNEDVVQEIVKHPASVSHSLVTTRSEGQSVDLGQIIDIERYAYVLRFIRNAKKNTPDGQAHKIPREPRTKELNAQELNQAEKHWIKTVQKASFAKELDFLESQKGTFPPVYVTQLGLFLDDQGIIRCKGRASNAPLSQPSKNPILFPSKHH